MNDLCAAETWVNLWSMLGSGDGTFQPPVLMSGWGSQTDDVALVDMDGDGALDIVSSTRTHGPSRNLRVQRGHGDATFGTPADFLPQMLLEHEHFFLGDFDGDGLVDVGVRGHEGLAILMNLVGE